MLNNNQILRVLRQNKYSMVEIHRACLIVVDGQIWKNKSGSSGLITERELNRLVQKLETSGRDVIITCSKKWTPKES